MNLLRRVLTLLAIVLTAASQAGWAQFTLGTPVMRNGEAIDAPVVVQYGPHDTFYVHSQATGVTLGSVVSVIWYNSEGGVAYKQSLNIDQAELKKYGTRTSYMFATRPIDYWAQGQYHVDLLLNGRVVQRARFAVGPQQVLANAPQVSADPRARLRYDGRPLIGRWVYLQPVNGRKVVKYIVVAEDGSYRGYEGERVVETGAIGVNGGATGAIAYRRSTDANVGYANYQLTPTSLIIRPDNGAWTVQWFRDGSAEAIALIRGQNPTVTPSPSPVAVATPSPQRATAEKLQVTGTFKYSNRDQGPQDPSTRFGAFEDIHCGIRGTVKKGSKIEALLRDHDGREVMKMTLDPMAKDGVIDKYSIPFRHPTQALAAGDYTIQVLLNDQDVDKPLKVTIVGASGPALRPESGGVATDPASMRDLVKVETAAAIKSATSSPGQRYALLIGVGKYENPGVQPLKFPGDDVSALRAVLENPQAGGFPRENVHVLTDGQATLASVGEQLVWLRGIATPADTVFIYFTGHGYNNGSRSYLGTANTDPDNLNFTALSVAKFNEAVSLIQAKKKIIVLDACHAGGMLIAARGDDKLTPQMLRELHERAEGEVRLLSCSQNETSKEDPQLGHGVFTYFLLKAMGPERAADANHDGVVTAGELYEYLSRQVRKYGAEHGYIQTPCAEQKVTGGVIIMSTRWK